MQDGTHVRKGIPLLSRHSRVLPTRSDASLPDSLILGFEGNGSPVRGEQRGLQASGTYAPIVKLR